MKTIKVLFNIWGNYCCFVGTERVKTFGNEFDAQQWLNEQYSTGNYKLSNKPYLQVTL